MGGGNDLCGAPGTPVAVADLTCKGGELDIRECSHTPPQTSCLGHERDAIVFCGMNSLIGFEEGASRLMTAEGAPSLDGIGRLEIFHRGAWGPVCKSGFTCGVAAPSVSQVSCSGQEASLFKCAHEVDDDVFCAPEESVVIHCNGQGNAPGRPRKGAPLKAGSME